MEELKEQIKVVAEARIKAVILRDKRDALMDEWNKANQELFDALTQAGADVAVEETKLRELALQAYELDKTNKAPAPGVDIREVTKLGYDPKEALKWALHHEIALTLDKKSFEGFAKATPLNFVTISTEPQATIAKDLVLD